MERKKIIAIYPGSFDPITLGHLDVLKRASTLFEKVIIAIAINSEKNPMFSKGSRLKMIKEVTKNIKNVEEAIESAKKTFFTNPTVNNVNPSPTELIVLDLFLNN